MFRTACMLSVTVLLGLATPAAGAGARLAAPPEVAAATPGRYILDESRSSLTARVMQLGVAPLTMRFGRFGGTLDVADDPTASRVEVVVDAASAEAGSGFDKDVAEEVLDPAQFPQMKFVSTRIEQTGPTTGRIHGDLTFRGVTRPVTLDARITAAAPDANGRPRVGVAATGSFKRSEFGATEFLAVASDEVRLQIEAEFSQQAQ